MRYLFIESKDFDVGVRVKKLDKNLRSYQHTSHQQDAMRQDRCFPWDTCPAHIFLGYRMSDDIEPALKSILLTCEGPSENDWHRVLWRPSAR